MDTCICMAESLRCSPETITLLAIPQYKIKGLKNKKTITPPTTTLVPIMGLLLLLFSH